VVVALSGGVDSAVAAHLLARRGYQLSAVTLRLRGQQDGVPVPTPEAIERARAISRLLGIPFRLIDAHDAFRTSVVDYFVAEYAAGRTPNPCVPCNRFVRFGLLMERGLAKGADHLATGHYARISETAVGCQLLRGRDPIKDQSYFLHGLSQRQLRHVLFPLGELTKETVRDVARKHRLAVAEQAESQDICFLAHGDYRRFLVEHAPGTMEPGPILDVEGQLLGQHQGLAGYTIGQRKGLGISASEPLYVLEIKPDQNALIVGTAAKLGSNTCLVEEMHYVSGEKPSCPFRAEAQIRYRARPVPITVEPLSGASARVHFHTPQRAVTPGQFLVLYEADVVLGGGIICEAQNSVL
jgi:tRNA-specific 2-thiouridylase